MEYHWPFAVCILLVSSFAIAAIVLLRKFEGAKFSGKDEIEDPSVVGVLPIGYLSRVELWSACGGSLNPNYLLVFRALCVLYLLPILVYNVVLKGSVVFFFYTECTFTLLIVYFTLAFRQSLLHYLEDRSSENRIIPRESITNHQDRLLNEDVETSSDGALLNGVDKAVDAPLREIQEGAGVEGYVTQCVFQTVLPAAVLTDLVYWGLLIPVFLPANFYHSFVDINMHAVNLVLLLIEFALNSLRFPWFRISYLILWSAAYCFLQWGVHSTGVTRWWPYPFMNVDTPYAPAWYLAIIFFHGVGAALCLLLALFKRRIWSRFNLPVKKAPL